MIISDSDDEGNALTNDAHWSPIRFKRVLEESASNNLASMEKIRINLCFICPESVFTNYEAEAMEDIPRFIKEIEIQTFLMKITRCRLSPPYTGTCARSSNREIECQDAPNGKKCNHCMARYQFNRLDSNVGDLTTTIRPADKQGMKILNK